MVNSYCCVGGCSNDSRYPERYVIRGHVKEIRFFKVPSKQEKRQDWIRQVAKGRKGFNPGKQTKVCSNHFSDGKPTNENPVPTLYLRPSDSFLASPKKRKIIEKKQVTLDESSAVPSDTELPENSSYESQVQGLVAMRFQHLTREIDVLNYTGFSSPAVFKVIFDYLSPKARVMQYWKGSSQSSKEAPDRRQYFNRISELIADSSVYDVENVQTLYERRGRKRKLTLEQEFLMTIMRLRVGLPLFDLAFRFNISVSLASSIFNTWIRLMRLELSVLVVWPSREQVRSTLPASFKKFYPKTRCIIDCTNWMVQRPSSLNLQAMMWSNYYNHTCLKYMIAITPNGSISYVSPCYTGRSSDKFVARDSGFYKYLQPYDQVMADRGFKIQDDLLLSQCTLAIPCSVRANQQMLPEECATTSNIANVRIAVENAIGKLKMKYQMLANTLPINALATADDIVRVCCAFCNLSDPILDSE